MSNRSDKGPKFTLFAFERASNKSMMVTGSKLKFNGRVSEVMLV